MSEKQRRRILAEVCAGLDRQMKKMIVPAAVGAGLALGAAGCGDDAQPTPDANAVNDGQALSEVGALYMAPAPDASIDGGAQPLYAAPDMAPTRDVRADTPPTPPYMAPDMGAAPLYMAPAKDGGKKK